MANAFASVTSGSDRIAAAPSGLAHMYDGLSNNVNRESEQSSVRLGVLMNAVGRQSYGPLLLIIGLFSISPATVLPGMTTVAAVVTLLIAGQMALGFQRPWLPKAILSIKVPRAPFFAFIDRTRPTVDRLDGNWVRPRWTFMTVPLFVNMVALCVIAAALITLPLSLIPFAPLIPGIAVVFFGIGMTARDGLWLSVGIAITAAVWFALPMVL
jgi:hypothetical protein